MQVLLPERLPRVNRLAEGAMIQASAFSMIALGVAGLADASAVLLKDDSNNNITGTSNN